MVKTYGYEKSLPIETEMEQRRIAAILPSIQDFSAFRDHVIGVSLWLSAALEADDQHGPGALSNKKTKKTLDSLADKLEAAENALTGLEDVPMDQIHRRAGGRGSNWRLDGAEAVQVLTNALKTNAVWAREASKFYVGKKGRPKNTEVDAAITELVEIWERQTSKRPTIATQASTGSKHGAFLDFCDAILGPIYAAHSIPKPSMQAVIQKVLYPKQEEK